MSSAFGRMLRLSIFGESHSPAIGAVIEGLPAGSPIDADRLSAFMLRRAPGSLSSSTARWETDKVEFLSGILNGKTTGTPLAFIIRNTDAKREDYAGIKFTPRPGHADYTGSVKYFGNNDLSGGGHFSGRLTAPLCCAGGIALQQLESEGILVNARIVRIGPVTDSSDFTESVSQKPFPAVSDAASRQMLCEIESARNSGDSLGGIIECRITGIPAGLGNPMFHGLESTISQAVFAIPAVKGIEFGDGFDLAQMTGSRANDAFCIKNGSISHLSNHAGGINGGISNGMPVLIRVAVKPTPSISLPQRSVDTERMEETELTVHGRHDACIVPRAVPCVEAACALAVYDAILLRRSEVYGH
ncbi:MAG: chorismate synthase [Clostridiales bacterium]|nr:chorismate synthase [Clostridiales bacterium]